ncbi:MAG: Rrf2 family transcriptional regulator [Senegalimassilia faecalis]
MDITRRCDYALRILRAAYKSGDEYVSVSEIAEKEDIPYAFARSIQHDLVKAGLIRTVRGARGGLVLNSDPADVTMLDVLEAIQGPVSVSLCAIDPDYCEKHADCAYNKVWHGADRLLNDYFSQITLRDLFERGAKSTRPSSRPWDMRPPPSRHVARGLSRRSWKGSLCWPRSRVPDQGAAPAWPEGGLGREAFVEAVRAEGARHHRDLPWRYLDDPYAVLVSEIMLQQTQVARVGRYWDRFLAAFPTLDALAAAQPAEVLELWQGLGYNRRALALKRAADQCAAEHRGACPRPRKGSGLARHRPGHGGRRDGLRP